MTDSLYGHIFTVSIGGRSIKNIRFADDIYGLAGSEVELRLVDRLEKTSIDYGMEINVDKTKIMANNQVRIITSIKVKNQAIEEYHNFIYIWYT